VRERLEVPGEWGRVETPRRQRCEIVVVAVQPLAASNDLGAAEQQIDAVGVQRPRWVRMAAGTCPLACSYWKLEPGLDGSSANARAAAGRWYRPIGDGPESGGQR